MFISHCHCIVGGCFFFFIHFILFSLKSYSALLFVVVVVDNNVVLIAITRVLFSSPSSLFHSIPCFVSSAGWFLVFLFSVDWNQLPLNRKTDTHSPNNKGVEKEKETLRHHAVCLYLHTFFPFTLLFSNFLSWHLGLILLSERDKKKLYIVHLSVSKCSYSNSFVGWLKRWFFLTQSLSHTLLLLLFYTNTYPMCACVCMVVTG